MLEKRLEKTDRIAFNHNDHMGRGKTFNGPGDIVNQSFGTIFEIPAVRFIAALIALGVLINYGSDVFDKMNKKKK